MPLTLQELITRILTDFLFLGAITSGILEIIYSYSEQLGRPISPNWKRLISPLAPFMVTLVAGIVGWLVGYWVFTPESTYTAIIQDVEAALGGSIIYAGYKLVKYGS